MFQHHWSENTHYFEVSNCTAQLTSYCLCTLVYQPKQPLVSKKSKVHPCTGTQALYRLYGP